MASLFLEEEEIRSCSESERMNTGEKLSVESNMVEKRNVPI